MADVGTLAGAAVARQSGVPICFSVAPDPHNVLRSLHARGELDLDAFADLDAETHVWFRARLVEQLTRAADRLALFPRSRPAELLDQLGLDESAAEGRAAVVAEGIDVDLIRRAESKLRTTGEQRTGRSVIDELGDLIPSDRRHLPLLVSIGRLNPVKGMERVVRAWAADPRLRARCNLVIVGGDLADPSPTEQRVLAAIDRAVSPADPRRPGLVLLGGRPRTDIATLLVAAVAGSSERWAAGGVYVDGALKEEFGLAVIEALAAGLVVVAPSTGGPPTYVDHGETGILADPDVDLACAVHDAFDLVDLPGRAERARAMVEERYSIDTMAGQLAALYRTTVPAS
jgi:glycosyltransferase involved in cell wall biosynthesis